jgi:hypothetical protein|tara:strand:- start:57 stop:188 length:132 start_codon:yes stop_codon:yes gene_type:complete
MDIDWTFIVNLAQLIALFFIAEATIKINRRQAEKEFDRILKKK